MYIYDRKLTGPQNRLEEPTIILRPAQRYYYRRRGPAELHFMTSSLSESAPVPTCYQIISPTSTLPTLGFEFDLSYGASTVAPPLNPNDPLWPGSVYSLEGKNISTHRIKKDGFRLEGDGNRIEIGTKPFELSAAGRKEMRQVMKAILSLVTDMRRQCNAAKGDESLGYLADVGAPWWFKPSWLESGVACVFPLKMKKGTPYYRAGCSVAAAPQATFVLPLARIDKFVTIIRNSEKVRVAGKALSGPPGWRQGTRSQALYDAQKRVNESRNRHIKAKTRLPSGAVVTEANFTPTLQGLLILMVSYLRTSELPYIHTSAQDYEIFAKSYLPLNVKNPFRLLYADLTPKEKDVFTALYDTPRTNLFALAKDSLTATASDGGKQLFPAIVKGHQECWFKPAPTWNDFVEKTITNTPLLRSEFCPGKEKKGEDVGCEVLFAPLSRLLPYKPGSRRVAIEMRRLGFNWVFSYGSEKGHPGWSQMTEMLFNLALGLNK
jgi:hypothetical protein